MTRRLLLATMALLALPGLPRATAASQEPPAVTAIRAEGIEIDGSLDEPAWREGPWIESFEVVGTGQEPPVATRAAFRFDDAYLYYGVICEEPDMDLLATGAETRDGPVWRDDCVELTIDAARHRNEYAHFIVNPAGVLYDAMRTEGGSRKVRDWQADVQVATRRGEDRWTVEMAIPLADLGIGWRSTRGPWYVLATRARRTQENAQIFAHIPNDGSFHSPKSFGPLVLEGADLMRYVWKLPGLPRTLVSRADDGAYAFGLRWGLRNLTGSRRDVRITAKLIGTEGEIARSTEINNTTAAETPFELTLPVAALGEYLLEVTVVDAAAPEVLLARRVLPVTLEYVPLKVTLTRPAYRNNIYATQALDSLRAVGRLNLPEAALAEPRPVEVSLYSNEAKEPIARKTLQAEAEEFDFKLVLPEMPVGEYVLVTTVEMPDGKTITDRQALRRLEAVENEWRLDEHRRLLRNGTPVLPYGLFISPGDTTGRDLAAEGVTCVFSYHMANRSPREVAAYLDALQNEGAFAIVDPWHWKLYRKRKHEPLADWEKKLLRERIEQIKDHPALAGYYMDDEPDLNRVSHERLRQAYEICREVDPYHPCVTLPAYIDGIYDYADTCDILMPDPYPRFLQDQPPAKPMADTFGYMRACRAAAGPGGAWWITPQAFDWHGQYVNSRGPTVQELRCQQYIGFIAGARGLLWYTDRYRRNSAAQDQGLAFLGREAQALRAAILAPEMPDSVRVVSAKEPEKLHATARQVGGHDYVFAASSRYEDQGRVELEVPGLQDGTLYVVSENRTVRATGGRIEDDFARYDVHIYTSDPAFAEGPSLAGLRRRVESITAELARPGNLAHASTGATVECSSALRWAAGEKFLNDGYRGMSWSSEQPGGGESIQVNLPEPTEVGRVVLYGSNLRSCRVLVREGDTWAVVSEAPHQPGTPLNVHFPPRRTDAVRLVGTVNDDERMNAQEIEVYAR